MLIVGLMPIAWQLPFILSKWKVDYTQLKDFWSMENNNLSYFQQITQPL